MFYLIYGLVSFVLSLAPIAAIVFLILWLTTRRKLKEQQKIINDLISTEHLVAETAPITVHQLAPTSPHEAKEVRPQPNDLAPEPHKMPVRTPVMAASTSMSPQVMITPSIELDDAELKAKKTMQNINIALYIASFLVVASASIFLTTSNISQLARFLVVTVVTVGFYCVGLLLYKKVSSLRPAGVAFVATGLATLPFIGVAAYQFLLPDVSLSWLITSIVGLVAYVIAALTMRNQIISYLSIAFAISTVLSATSVSHAPLIAYFVVMILFGTLMSILAVFGKKFIPQSFVMPVENTNQWIIPVTLGAAVFSYFQLNLRDYVVLFSMGALYYLAVGLASKDRRELGFYLSRSLAILAILIGVYDNSHNLVHVGVAVSIIGLVNVFSSMLLSAIVKERESISSNEQWLIIGLAMQLAATFFVLSDSNWPAIVTAQLLAAVITSLLAAVAIKKVIYSAIATIGLSVLPIIIGFRLIEPALESHFVALMFLGLAITPLAIRVLKKGKIDDQLSGALHINYGIFLTEALLYSITGSHEWGIAIWLTVIGSILFVSYLEKQRMLTILSNILLFIMVYQHVVPYELEPQVLPIAYLIASTLALGVPYLLPKKISTGLSSILLVHAGLFIVQSLLFSLNTNNTWGAIVYIANAAIIVWLSFASKIPLLSILGNLLFSLAMWRYIYPDTSYEAIACVFTAFAGGLVLLRWLLPIKHSSSLHKALLLNLAIFIAQSMYASYQATDIRWLIGLWLANAVFIYALTYIERLPALVVASNIIVAVALFKLPEAIDGLDSRWWYSLSASLTVGCFSVGYAVLKYLKKTKYSNFFILSLILPNLFNSLTLMSIETDLVLASSAIALVSLSVVFVESVIIRNYWYVSLVVSVMNLVGQRLFYVYYPEADKLVYTHWWAAVAIGLGLMMHFIAKQPKQTTLNFLYASLALITFPTAIASLWPSSWSSYDVPYQMIFIIEQALIVVAGLLLRIKPVSIWGGVGIVLAVIWMIREYTAALLAVIAVVLIGLAVYTLLRQSRATSKKQEQEKAPKPEEPTEKK